MAAMIGCENINNDIKWFHIKCLKIKNRPNKNSFIQPATQAVAKESVAKCIAE